jgi:hypothetical protein
LSSSRRTSGTHSKSAPDSLDWIGDRDREVGHAAAVAAPCRTVAGKHEHVAFLLGLKAWPE